MADQIVKFKGVKETVKILRQVEPEMYKQFRKDIRSITQPAVVKIRQVTPVVAPLSGMNNNGPKGWSKVNVTTAITPSQRSRAVGSTTSNLVAIKASGRNKQYGFDIADMAGRRSNGRTPQGQALISGLNQRRGKPSRFVYSSIESMLPMIKLQVAASVDKMASVINRKLDRVR